MNRLRCLLKVESGEELPALSLFVYPALAPSAYIIVKATRDALFLNRCSAVTLLVAVALAIIGMLLQYSQHRYSYPEYPEPFRQPPPPGPHCGGWAANVTPPLERTDCTGHDAC